MKVWMACGVVWLQVASGAAAQEVEREYWDDGEHGIADTAWFTADPRASAFSITNAYELGGLALLVNNGITNFTGQTLRLVGEIDLSGRRWRPIGGTNNSDRSADAAKHFGGTFEGNGHAIWNMQVINNDSNQTVYGGLFGVVLAAGRIQNLRLRDISVDVTGADSDDFVYAGGLAAVTYGALSNCSVRGTIRGVSTKYALHAGCLSARTEKGSVITDCAASGDVFSVSMRGTWDSAIGAAGTGGLIGRNDGVVSRCWFEGGTVTGSNTVNWVGDVGGAVGRNNGMLTNVHVAADILATGRGDMYAGGMVGYNGDGANLVNCRVAGTVGAVAINDHKASAGGICGGADGEWVLNNVSACSAIVATAYDSCTPYAGGVLGYNGNLADFGARHMTNNCFLASTVSTFKQKTGVRTDLAKAVGYDSNTATENANFAYDPDTAAGNVTNLNAYAMALSPSGGCCRWKLADDGTPDFALGRATVAERTGGVPVPYRWIENHFGGALIMAAGDYQGAAWVTNLPNGYPVWENYLLGITNALDRFWAAIRMDGDEPVITWMPSNDLANVVYTVHGATNLDGTVSAGWSGQEKEHRFFRVRAEWK